MRLQPVGARPYFRQHGHVARQGKGRLHTTHNNGFNFIHLILMGVKDQLIMHLKKHFRFEPLQTEGLIHPDHGQLDHIGSRTLDRGVDGIPFRKPPDGKIR